MRNKKNQTRVGFTLIELLVVISIIAFMSGMFVVAYRGAAQESHNQKTRTTIQKISEVLNARMEEYSSYPIVLRRFAPGVPAVDGFPLPSNTASQVPTQSKTLLLERARLLTVRELVAMEMPDHPDDIKWSDKWVTGQSMTALLNSVPKAIPTGLVVGSVPVTVKSKPTSRTFGLARKLNDSSGKPIAGWQNTNANAELLYLIVEDSDLDGSSAIELFGASETADTDNDGLKEFVDAFRKPIQWIRWPTGFEGIGRYHPDMLDPGIITGSGPTFKITIESDPLDRMSADPGYMTGGIIPGPGAFPLVVSGGEDGVFGIRLISNPMNPTPPFSYSVIDAQWSLPGYLNGARFTDPWYPRSTPADRLGTRDTSKSSLDNITNYDGNGASL